MRWQDLSDQDIENELQQSLPSTLRGVVNFDPQLNDNGKNRTYFDYQLRTSENKLAFSSGVFLDFNNQSAKWSFVESHPDISQYKGIGVQSLANLADFLSKIDINILNVFAGEVGGYLWAACGAKLDWNDDHSREENMEFRHDCMRDLRLLHGQNYSVMTFAEKWVENLERGNLDALTDLVAFETPLYGDEYLSRNAVYKSLAQRYGEGHVSMAQFMLMNKTWAGYFDLHDEKQMQHLKDFAAQKFRPAFT